MIGNLVVVKDEGLAYIGTVLEEREEYSIVECKHIREGNYFIKRFRQAIALKENIIKKSSRPVKMKQQLSLEEQQPTTL